MQSLCSNCTFWNKIGEMPGRPGQFRKKSLEMFPGYMVGQAIY